MVSEWFFQKIDKQEKCVGFIKARQNEGRYYGLLFR